MSKKNKNIILIISTFILFMFLYEIVILPMIMKWSPILSSADTSIEWGMLGYMLVQALIYPSIIVSIVALIVRFNKKINQKIDKTYRKIIYYLPIYALVLSPLIGLLSGYFLEMIHII